MLTHEKINYQAPECSFGFAETETVLCDSIGVNNQDFNDVTDIEW